MKSKIIVLCMICLSMSALSACSKTESKDIENKSVDTAKEVIETQTTSKAVTDRKLKLEGDIDSKNDIFTEEFYTGIQKLEFWYQGNAIEITKDSDIEAIFKLLASVKMDKYTPSVSEMKYGFSIMDITTLDKTYQIGILEGEFMVDGANYKVDKDVVNDIRTVVLKYTK